MKIEILVVGRLQTNCYLVYCQKTREALIIDPGDDGDYIINKIRSLDLIPKAIVATHGHFDHVLAITELKLAFKIPFYLHQKDLKILKRAQSTARYFLGIEVDPVMTPDELLKKGSEIKFDRERLQVLETPGHTEGSISLHDGKKHLFVGDTIFANGGYGRTDLEGGSKEKIDISIKKLLKMQKKTLIYPGHGKLTTVANEIKFWENVLK